MSEGRILFNMFFRPAAVRPSFLTFFSSFLLPRRSMLVLAGDLTQLHLPVGMKKLNLRNTTVTGKAQLREWRSEGESSLNIN